MFYTFFNVLSNKWGGLTIVLFFSFIGSFNILCTVKKHSMLLSSINFRFYFSFIEKGSPNRFKYVKFYENGPFFFLDYNNNFSKYF